MKRLAIIIILLIGLLAMYLRTMKPREFPGIQSPIPTSYFVKQNNETAVRTQSIEDDGHSVSYNIVVATPSQIRLFSNLQASTDSASAKVLYGCDSLINAGFYTKEYTHLGLFIAESMVIHPSIESTLVDGFLSIPHTAPPSISFDEPTNSPRIAVQSGPIIRTDGEKRLLRLIEDKFARRSIAGVTTNGTVVFLTLYFTNQEFSGPLLTRTPYILEKILTAEHLDVTDALNLDGGSASAFISDHISLFEFSPIGGFFCIRE